MHMLIYLMIFSLKLLENALGTLRMILVSHQKKMLGAILQFVIAIVWLVSAYAAITNITNDPLKVLAFSLGSAFGSYIGSILEQKIALGQNLLICISHHQDFITRIEQEQIAHTVLQGFGTKGDVVIVLIALPRKQKVKMQKHLKEIDPSCYILCNFTEIPS